MKQWEYKFIAQGKLFDTYAPWNEKTMEGNKEGIRTLTALNNLGKQGWEYVEHGRNLHGFHDERRALTYVFKREKKNG